MGENTLGNGLKIESFFGGGLQVTTAKRVQERLNILSWKSQNQDKKPRTVRTRPDSLRYLKLIKRNSAES